MNGGYLDIRDEGGSMADDWPSCGITNEEDWGF